MPDDDKRARDKVSAGTDIARPPGGGYREEQIGAAPLRGWTFLVIAAGIVLVALLLRVYRIGEQQFWLDEAFSFSMVDMPNWVGRALVDSNPPLYYLLLRVWAIFAGQSEAGLRLLSACFGTLFVAAVIWAGREIYDSRVGLWGGGFAAVAPIHIYYSQEARTYTLLTLALLLTYIALWRALIRNTWWSWALVSACAVFALYSHYLAILGLLPTAFLLLLWPEKKDEAAQRWLRYAGAGLLSGLLFLPWLLGSFVFTSHSLAPVSWIQHAWELTPPSLAIPKSLEVLGLGSQAHLIPIFLKQFTNMEVPSSLRVLGLALLLLLGIWAAVPWGDSRMSIPWLGKRKAWLGALLFFPLVVMWLVSFYRPLYVAGRYDIMAFPPYALLLGLALDKVSRVKKAGPIVALIAALGLLIPIGTKLSLYYNAATQRPTRAFASVLDSSVANGDVVVITGHTWLPVLYYLNRLGYRWDGRYCDNKLAGRRFFCRLFPREWEQPFFPFPPHASPRPLNSVEVVQEDVQDYLGPLRTQAGGLWVMFGGYSYDPVQRKHFFSKDDALLIREVVRLGLKPVSNIGALGIFQFRGS